MKELTSWAVVLSVRYDLIEAILLDVLVHWQCVLEVDTSVFHACTEWNVISSNLTWLTIDDIGAWTRAYHWSFNFVIVQFKFVLDLWVTQYRILNQWSENESDLASTSQYYKHTS